jgi:hypothetical protein
VQLGSLDPVQQRLQFLPFVRPHGDYPRS